MALSLILNELQKQHNALVLEPNVFVQPTQQTQAHIQSIQTRIPIKHSSDFTSPPSTPPSNSNSNSNVTTPVTIDNRKRQRERERDDWPSDSSEEVEVRDVSVFPITTLTTPFIPLCREQILQLNSDEIEQYVTNLKATRALSPSEERELKKQRRMIKNREYASQSRERKKNYQEGLEHKLDEQEKEIKELRVENESLRTENDLLRIQLRKYSTSLDVQKTSTPIVNTKKFLLKKENK